MATGVTSIKRVLTDLNSHPRRPHLKPAIHRGLFRYRLLTAAFRLMPDFVIIGAARAGTTSLYNYLSAHPHLTPALRKEVHFFDDNFEKGERWYRAHFPSMLSKRGAGLRGRGFITGESTPYYLFHPLAPERMARTVPAAKLIVLLRNPIDRAFSQYQHEVRVGVFDDITFEEAIERELEMLDRGVEKVYRHYNCLSKGIYVDQLQLWARMFPREQMLIMRGEDLYADPQKVLLRALDFLDLPRWEPKEYEHFHKSDYSQMNTHTRRRLVEFFEPHNQRLSEYLGLDPAWDR